MSDKLKEKIEKTIKMFEEEIDGWEPTTPSLIRSKREIEVRIGILKELIKGE